MGRIEKTVFISYRRTNVPWALAIYQDLHHNGYDVFFDYQSIDSGDFEKIILDNIRARAHFIVVLTPSALERCKEPNDWLRREIEAAIDEKRNIVPLMMEGFDFGSPLVTQVLTGKLSALSSKNGLPIYAEYFFEGMEKLRQRYLNVALSDIPLYQLSSEAKAITKSLKLASSDAPPVKKKELSAQVWLERGYVFASNSDLDEANRCFTEAISLYPNFEAYFNRGIIRREIGDLDGAIQDYDLATHINPNQAQTYNNRGNARRDKGDLQGAISDYDTAIHLNPNAARVLINRGIVRRIQGNLDGALADFAKAINLKTTLLDLAEAYYNRGAVFQLKGALEDSIKDHQQAISIASYHVMARAALISVLRSLGRTVEADEQEKMARKLVAGDSEYNRACFEAICGNIESALELLKIGMERGYPTKEWARLDPDLEILHDDPRFKALVE
jgi:tetratricopeptide (TPR) repeat protein